ncbi:sphingomyelin phosphodiesterase, putative [Plasmodium berghei]|uniref:Sphingomyelin phosphodiesterase, putative n=2 Tax=Plasmodium berghei TaxID=5821 RepID=A0A509B1I1_PLABA|nr:sphingomyelin phosphodiesterase, putative [Plasmodium berghei ANKA]CXJ26571.1 sphingomyelin phosphodiesterase, putative [Plasmodium berghei]SCN28712.1 sphingomyelin phosphodiesterase, putative [Plasmodium berghei]VUC58594.1 sphingomyelin phosphodiesterase, putative [Plasmodium berghei ANKA]|eukprot:XP_034424357.1 sphingomyelin phosphodiesterase, putative [Plasmodium berghei ANKA]
MELITRPDQHFTIMSYNVQMIPVPISTKINIGYRQKTLEKYICELDDIYNADILVLNEVFTKQAYNMFTTGEIKKRFPYHTSILGGKIKNKINYEDDNDDDEYYNTDLFSKNIERDIKEFISNDYCNNDIYDKIGEENQECGCSNTGSQIYKNEIKNRKKQKSINSNGLFCNGSEKNANVSIREEGKNNNTCSDKSIKNNINNTNKFNNQNCETCKDENNKINGNNMISSTCYTINDSKDIMKKKKKKKKQRKKEKRKEDPPPFDSISGEPKFRHFLNGGIIVLSKHKILQKHALIFENSKFPEMFSAKGAIYLKFNIKNNVIHVVATHLHAGNNKSDEKCRLKQIEELTKWVYHGIPSTFINKYEPLFFVGDFNIRYIKDEKFFKEITSNKYLNCVVTNNTLETTYDSSINDYCRYVEDDFEHKYVDTLDYILVSKDSNVKTIVPQTAVQRDYKPISIFKTMLCCIPYQSINIHHASDHFPIYATFKLPNDNYNLSEHDCKNKNI